MNFNSFNNKKRRKKKLLIDDNDIIALNRFCVQFVRTMGILARETRAYIWKRRAYIRSIRAAATKLSMLWLKKKRMGIINQDITKNKIKLIDKR